MVANKPFNTAYEMKRWMWDHDELTRQENSRLDRTANIVKSVFIRGNAALKNRWISHNGQANGMTILANNTEAQFNINVGLLNGTELRFWDVGSSNYVGFEAPALVANQIWVLPAADGNAAEVLGTNAAGTLGWYTASSMAGGLHDGDTLQHDSVNSNGGAFAFNTTGAVTFSNTVALTTCVNAGVDTDKFLVLDAANNIDFRTGAEMLSDIGAMAGGGTVDFIPRWTGIAVLGNSVMRQDTARIGVGMIPVYTFDIAGGLRASGDVLFPQRVGIVDGWASNVNLRIVNATLNTTGTHYNTYLSMTKTAGGTSDRVDFYGIYNNLEISDADQEHGLCYAIYNVAQLSLGGISGNNGLYGIYSLTTYDAGTFTGELDGITADIYSAVGADITGNAYGLQSIARLAGDVSGSVYALLVTYNVTGTVAGTEYSIYIDETQAPDYCIYQSGTARSRFGGGLLINDGGDDSDSRISGDNLANLFYVDAGNDRVGINTSTPASLLEIERNQNAMTTVQVDNNTAGTAAGAEFLASSDTADLYLSALSGTYTTSNQYIADSCIVEAYNAANLVLSNSANLPICFYQNGARSAIFNAGGLLDLGADGAGNQRRLRVFATDNVTTTGIMVVDSVTYNTGYLIGPFGMDGIATDASGEFLAFTGPAYINYYSNAVLDLVYGGGNVRIFQDNQYFLWGRDAAFNSMCGIMYDGTDMVIDPAITGSGTARFENSIKIVEIAEAVADTAGYGQLWCKDNAGTTELWFTDDTGTDTQIV